MIDCLPELENNFCLCTGLSPIQYVKFFHLITIKYIFESIFYLKTCGV